MQRRQRQALLNTLDRISAAVERLTAHQRVHLVAEEAAALKRAVIHASVADVDPEVKLSFVLRIDRAEARLNQFVRARG